MKTMMNELIQQDAFRITGTSSYNLFRFRKNYGFMTLYFYRRLQGAGNKFVKRIYRHFYSKYARLCGVEIPEGTNLGGGGIISSSLKYYN